MQKKKTRVLVILLGQKIQHEMHPKSSKALSPHLLFRCLCARGDLRLFAVSVYLFCAHTSAFTYMSTSVQKTLKHNTPLQEERAKTDSPAPSPPWGPAPKQALSWVGEGVDGKHRQMLKLPGQVLLESKRCLRAQG